MKARQVFIATLAVLAGLAVGYIVLTSVRILVILLLAIIVASSARPLVARLTRLGLSVGIAIPLIYAGILFSVLILFLVVLPPVLNQATTYLENDWRLANRIILTKSWLEERLTLLTEQEVVLADNETIRETITATLTNIRRTAPDMLDDVGGVLGETVLIIVMGIYWLTAREKSILFVTRLVPTNYRLQTQEALREIEDTMGAYTRGMVFVALFVGLANFAILALLRIPNAATYGFIVGITTMLPIIGGLIGGGLATLLALLGSPIHGLAVFAVFVLVQQVEVHYLTPRTMSRSIGVDPLLVMVAVFVGFALYGVVGAIIAIPLLGTVNVLLRTFVVEPRQERVAPYAMEEGVPVFRGPAATEVNGTATGVIQAPEASSSG
ncbi:MAG: AI-2E family transporter [Chloroflexi bacterium]|nr:AI-2E family transporter [Chloroflexota bacterium]